MFQKLFFTLQESRTKVRAAQHLPEEALKNIVDELTVKLQSKDQERHAAEEARNYFQLERVPSVGWPKNNLDVSPWWIWWRLVYTSF